MELHRDNRVVFYEDEHRYLLDGEKELNGVTTIMKVYGLSPDYGSIDPEVLAHAAEMGTMAHKAIESYCAGEAVVQNSLIKSFKSLGLDVVCCEYLVTDYDSIASSIDMIVKVDENTVDLIDMKRTSSVHQDALSWQLGIYKVLFEQMNPYIKVRDCYCLHIKKGLKNSIEKDICEPLIPVIPADAGLVGELIDAVQMGLDFCPEQGVTSLPMTQSELDALIIAEQSFAMLEATYKANKAKLEEQREVIYKHMMDNKLESIAVGNGVYTIKKPYTRQTLDTKELKRVLPEIFARYATATEVKGSVTFKQTE